ncbi:hypothetical protein PFICI_01512 [Pestalotiopsis fici W106-1]|uniref:Alternative oxidase n=1 Tax=Pestalotiopsis fici (strain W106-1 / CGMCC3.15140) TaxID=1229662 RepID=W3XNY4_PESFW|nr:uncharacterized protein PFICI_01512 [Pestalotiopsis fici W106-1]ETS87684.1 hypothetical protein PFICI_01512 [Pestalotiopsis fici W106-1]
MISSTRVSSLLKILVAFVIFIWSLWYFEFATPDYRKVVGHFKSEKADHLDHYLQHEVGAPFDGEAIAALCANRTWTKGLIFHCDAVPGGIGEVRNAHLNCIRFAMEAGAELILPEVVKRNEKDISITIPPSKGTPRSIPLDYYYDRQHLNQTLSRFCPQMTLIQSIDELYNTPMGNPVTISVANVGMDMVNGSMMKSPETWREKYQQFVDTKSDAKIRTWPFRVILSVDTYVWPTAYDSPGFVSSFGRILRFREDARILSASAVSAMQQHALKPQEGQPPEYQGMQGFVGVHLRTEKDIWNTEFPPYEEQAAYYLDFITKSPYRLAYLATGDTTGNVTAFKEKARGMNVTVFTKNDLLDLQERDYLASLSWDQQALIDYEVLLRADLTAGISASSFTWNVALRRAAAAGYVGGEPPASNVAEHVRWWDGTSLIVGNDDKNMDMQMGIWP